MSNYDQPKTDADWRAEQDAETIAEAKIILADSERLRRAQAAADRKAAELHERASKMDSVADSKTLKPAPSKTGISMKPTLTETRTKPGSTTQPTALSVTVISSTKK